jgi:hypothetical protein
MAVEERTLRIETGLSAGITVPVSIHPAEKSLRGCLTN